MVIGISFSPGVHRDEGGDYELADCDVGDVRR
jgi:hypothetical protein